MAKKWKIMAEATIQVSNTSYLKYWNDNSAI